MRRAPAILTLVFALSCAHPRVPQPAASPSSGGSGGGAKACGECHGASLAAQRKARSVHAVIRDETACGECHLPHDGEKTAPLASPEPRLCRACHADRAFTRPHGATAECTPCHAPHASAEAALLKATPSALCGGCHPDLAKGHAGYPVAASRCTECHHLHGTEAKLLNPLVHEVASDCTNCHAAAGSPRPLAVSKPPPALCFDCHPEVQERIAKQKTAHPPAKGGSCTSCHSPHSSQVKGLLAGTALEVCGACHAAVIEATRRPTPHKPAADGRCGDCHAAHGGERAKLLTQPPDALCTSCHPVVEEWVAKKHVHAPLQMGDCQGCHDPHGGAKRLLKADAVTLCLRCHAKGKEGFIAGSHVHPGEPKGDCLGCHDPHASDAPRLVIRSDEALCRGCHEGSIAARRDRGERLHTPFAGGSCTACHTPHASGKAGLRSGDVCADCHLGTRPNWTKGQSSHPPFAEGSCYGCHEGHGSKERALLRRKPNDLCAQCHPGAKDALKNHDTCSDCHRGHGSTQPALLVNEPARLCVDCHDATSKGAVSGHGGYDVSDADCTGCHLPHSAVGAAAAGRVAHEPFGSSQCEACHAPPEVPPTPATLKQGGLDRCARCHDFSAILKLPDAHAPVAAGRCFDCHAPHRGFGKAILRTVGAALCRRCHDAKATSALPAHQQAGPAAGECGKCHPPHAPMARSAKRR